MNHPFKSKGIFIWQVYEILKGDPVAIASLLSEGGFESAYIKTADGPYKFNSGGRENCSEALVQALHDKGIAAVGWSFNYGVNPVGEARAGAAAVNRYGLDGYIWDVEGYFEKQPDAVNAARIVTAEFRAQCSRHVPTALCSWAFWKNRITGSTIHATPVARAFMEQCEYGMPMQYWQGTSGAAVYAEASVRQWRELVTQKPLIPTGRAYNGDGGTCTPEQMREYEETVRELHCPGISWWGLDWAEPASHPTWWSALREMRGFGVDGSCPPAPDGRVPPNAPDSTANSGGQVQWEPLFGGAARIAHGKLKGAAYHVIELDWQRWEPRFDDGVVMSVTPNYMFRTKCKIAINGLDGWETVVKNRRRLTTLQGGIVINRGRQFGRQNGMEQILYITPGNRVSLVRPSSTWAACGFPNLLIKDGYVQKINKAVDDLRARTAFGVNASQTKAYLLTVDGKDFGSVGWQWSGLNFQDTAALMLGFGCDLAVMADGGGSTTMCVEGVDGKPEIIGEPAGDDPMELWGKQYRLRRVAVSMGFNLRGGA
jgi:hypothetical protein